MPDVPTWVSNPRDPNAPIDLAHYLRDYHLRRVFCEQAGVDPAAITDEQFAEIVAELGGNKQLLAIVEADSVEAAALHTTNAERAEDVLAVQATKSGLHRYHPMRYPSAGAMLRDKRAGLDPEKQASEWYNLNWLIEVFVPWMEAHGRNGLEALWQPGTKAKSRIMADILHPALAAAGVNSADDAPHAVPPELEAKIDQLMLEVANPAVHVPEFKKNTVVQQHRTEMAALEAWDYKLPSGGYLVLQYMDEAQRVHVERAVKAEWHLGTGKEAFLPLLKAKKTVKGRKMRKTAAQKVVRK